MFFATKKKGFRGDVPSKVKITTRDLFTDANKGKAQGSTTEEVKESVPVVHYVPQIMARLCPPRENSSPPSHSMDPPPPIIEPNLYSYVPEYEDLEALTCMMME
ncbi:unnamed protein product [Prunus armeniaca]